MVPSCQLQCPARLLSHPCSSHPGLTQPTGKTPAQGGPGAAAPKPGLGAGMGMGWEPALLPNPTPLPALESLAASAAAWLGLGNVFIQEFGHWDHRVSLGWSWREHSGMSEWDQRENQQENPLSRVPGTPLPLGWSQADPQPHPRPVGPAKLLGKQNPQTLRETKDFYQILVRTCTEEPTGMLLPDPCPAGNYYA